MSKITLIEKRMKLPPETVLGEEHMEAAVRLGRVMVRNAVMEELAEGLKVEVDATTGHPTITATLAVMSPVDAQLLLRAVKELEALVREHPTLPPEQVWHRDVVRLAGTIVGVALGAPASIPAGVWDGQGKRPVSVDGHKVTVALAPSEADVAPGSWATVGDLRVELGETALGGPQMELWYALPDGSVRQPRTSTVSLRAPGIYRIRAEGGAA